MLTFCCVGAAKIKNLFALDDGAKAERFHLLSVMLTVNLDSGLTYVLTSLLTGVLACVLTEL